MTITVLLIVFGIAFLVGVGVGVGVHERRTRWRERWLVAERYDLEQLARDLDHST